jgi:fused signal recognition particle receptor
MWSAFKKGLQKSSQKIRDSLRFLGGNSTLTAQHKETLEESLILADLGPMQAARFVQELTEKGPESLEKQLLLQMHSVLKPLEKKLEPQKEKCLIILAAGVNGSGKTTTLGKWATRWQKDYSVRLAAADTFRAAASEQLEIWAHRAGCKITRLDNVKDPASIVFQAMDACREENTSVLLIDTAGRLPNKPDLMAELQKIDRIINKQMAQDPDRWIYEKILILDATTGQHALTQAQVFNECLSLTGLALTKLDGTAKGGMLFQLADQLKLPICELGLGEKKEDLHPFDALFFCKALFSDSLSQDQDFIDQSSLDHSAPPLSKDSL